MVRFDKKIYFIGETRAHRITNTLKGTVLEVKQASLWSSLDKNQRQQSCLKESYLKNTKKIELLPLIKTSPWKRYGRR